MWLWAGVSRSLVEGNGSIRSGIGHGRRLLVGNPKDSKTEEKEISDSIPPWISRRLPQIPGANFAEPGERANQDTTDMSSPETVDKNI